MRPLEALNLGVLLALSLLTLVFYGSLEDPGEILLRFALMGAFLALVDDSPGANPLAGAGPYYAPRSLGYEELLGLLLDSSGETVRCLAAYHVGELGLANLGQRLEALREREKGFFAVRVVERALKVSQTARQTRTLHSTPSSSAWTKP